MMRMTKLLTGLLAAFTSSIALVMAVHTLLVPEGRATWVAWKLLSTVAALVQGALTLHYLLSRRAPGPARIRLLRAGAIALVPLGAATVLVTVHLARLTGDWEMYMIAAGLAMILQGLLTTWNLRKRTPAEV